MSLLNRRRLLLAPLALAACGFQPVYAPGGSGAALQNRITVSAPQDRDTYILVRELETRLGRSNNAAYALDLTVSTFEEGLAVDRAGDINRFNLVGKAEYALRDLTSGNVITSGSEENFTAYSTTGTTVATLAAEQDAQVRLMTILADQIVTRLHASEL